LVVVAGHQAHDLVGTLLIETVLIIVGDLVFDVPPFLDFKLRI
jgi:hypothetical protein